MTTRELGDSSGEAGSVDPSPDPTLDPLPRSPLAAISCQISSISIGLARFRPGLPNTPLGRLCGLIRIRQVVDEVIGSPAWGRSALRNDRG
jgi:hypothetical protein